MGPGKAAVGQAKRGADRSARAATLAAGLAFACVLVPAPAGATTYKWVDENGVTHYTDKMPADQIGKGRTELDKQGRPIRKVDPVLTPEQRQAKEAEAERQAAEAREQERVRRRDKALMASYSSEDEIDLARSRVLATIESQVQAAKAYNQQLVKREAELVAKKKSLGDKPLPAGDERELEAVQAELSKQQALMALKQRERDATNARYDADKARWKQLRAIADANASAEPLAGNGSASATRKTSSPAK